VRTHSRVRRARRGVLPPSRRIIGLQAEAEIIGRRPACCRQQVARARAWRARRWHRSRVLCARDAHYLAALALRALLADALSAVGSFSSRLLLAVVICGTWTTVHTYLALRCAASSRSRRLGTGKALENGQYSGDGLQFWFAGLADRPGQDRRLRACCSWMYGRAAWAWSLSTGSRAGRALRWSCSARGSMYSQACTSALRKRLLECSSCDQAAEKAQLGKHGAHASPSQHRPACMQQQLTNQPTNQPTNNQTRCCVCDLVCTVCGSGAHGVCAERYSPVLYPDPAVHRPVSCAAMWKL
jgi:hypothetical protein